MHLNPDPNWKSPTIGFNEAAGADPADASSRPTCGSTSSSGFNEAAGADPADAR